MDFMNKMEVDDCFRLVKTCFKEDDVMIKEQEISRLRIKGKTIIVLCGNNTKNPMRAFSYAYYCLNWLKGSEYQTETTVYSIFYPHRQPLSNTFVPNSRFNYEELTKVIFNQIIKENGKCLSVDKIVEKLHNVMFFGHSMGGFVMNELMDNLKQLMQQEGYTNSDIDRVYSSILFLGYSPFSLVESPINKVYITPMYDSFGSTKLVFDELVNKEGIVSTNPKVSAEKVYKLRAASKSDFIRNYGKYIDNQDVAYYLVDNMLFATPNLLYDDGREEDHNLAGIIDYKEHDPNKTKAGYLMTEFIQTVFNAGFSLDRADNLLQKIYEQSVQNLENSKNKEL